MNTQLAPEPVWPPDWAFREALEIACQVLSAGRQRHEVPEVSAALAKLETELRGRIPAQPTPTQEAK